MAGPEINAPVFPVETKHNFPPEPPVREPAPGKDDLKFPDPPTPRAFHYYSM